MAETLKVRAPELTGRRWLGTAGKDLKLTDLRGKIVLLDFWSFCCINCLHVLDELRPLEEKYSDVLVIIGVHSPKFEFERTEEALDKAVERYHVDHIVLDDPDLITWQAYTARAWPTLAVVDPEGYLVASMSGEGHSAGLTGLIDQLVAEHESAGTLHRGDGPYVPPPAPEGELFFPGKITRLATAGHRGNLLVSDSGHHSLVEYDPAGITVLARIGSGQRGKADGGPAEACFSEPGGTTELPAELADRVGYHVVVADTVNHELRGVNLDTGAVTTLAGTGEQYMVGAGDNVPARPGDTGRYAGPATGVKLSSPWDVLFVPATGRVLVAMAGNHTIWEFDPATGLIRQFSGTMNEGLKDAGAEEAWFAQTSGLSLSAAGDVLVADSETSALRRLDPATGAVTTLVGTGLFDFGFQDGPAAEARLQHPLGAAELPDGSIAIADTYNGAIRRFDPVSGRMSTLARDLAEPSDILVLDDAEPARLLVAESAAHRLTAVSIPADALEVNEGAQQTSRPATVLGTGELDLQVSFSVPAGQKLDDRWGDPTYLQVSSTPPELITAGAGGAEGLSRSITLADGFAEGVLHVTARAAACDGEPGGEIPLHAACHLYQQDWGIPVEFSADGPHELELGLRGA
jgi:thiol-disulfide isomerase/thioredoxin